MADCNTCALQYKDACPNQWGAVSACSKYVEKHFDPHPPRKGGRYKPEPGEYPREGTTHYPPAVSSPKRPKTGTSKPPAKRSSVSPAKRTPKRSTHVIPASEVREGRQLFYRNMYTGIIGNGVVTAAYKDGFEYVFDGRKVFFSYDVIGSRLFFSWKEAWLYYKKKKN